MECGYTYICLMMMSGRNSKNEFHRLRAYENNKIPVSVWPWEK